MKKYRVVYALSVEATSPEDAYEQTFDIFHQIDQGTPTLKVMSDDQYNAMMKTAPHYQFPELQQKRIVVLNTIGEDGAIGQTFHHTTESDLRDAVFEGLFEMAGNRINFDEEDLVVLRDEEELAVLRDEVMDSVQTARAVYGEDASQKILYGRIPGEGTYTAHFI